MATHCPACHAMAKTRTSFEVTDNTRKSYHQCQNMLCGLCFVTLTTVVERLNTTSAVPGAHVPRDAFPRSNYGEDQMDLAL